MPSVYALGQAQEPQNDNLPVFFRVAPSPTTLYPLSPSLFSALRTGYALRSFLSP